MNDMAIQQGNDGGLREIALFAGAGGGILGSQLLGHRIVCAVERNAYAATLLARRQNDGLLPAFPVWSDVTTFDGRPWKGRADIVSGGFPCQDISCAGKGAGIDGERSGLWSEGARIIGEVEPAIVWLENSPMLTSRGLGRVLGDLAAMGFDAKWGVLGAREAGFTHQRDRMWIFATHPERRQRGQQQHDGPGGRVGGQQQPFAWDRHWIDVFTGVRGNGHGLARNVDRTDAIRNGQVPRVVVRAWEALK